MSRQYSEKYYNCYVEEGNVIGTDSKGYTVQIGVDFAVYDEVVKDKDDITATCQAYFNRLKELDDDIIKPAPTQDDIIRQQSELINNLKMQVEQGQAMQTQSMEVMAQLMQKMETLTAKTGGDNNGYTQVDSGNASGKGIVKNKRP